MGGCIKETYDMSKLSKQMHYSPSLAMAVATGNISIGDIVKSNDTIVFDKDNFIRLIFKKDSVINIKLNDYKDFDDMTALSFKKGYPILPVPVYSFKDTVTFKPGSDIEIEKLFIKTGSIVYKFISKSLVSASLTITLPTVLRGAAPVTQIIAIPAKSTVPGSLSVNNTDVNLSTDPKMRFNRLPINFSISTTSGNFNLNDSIYLELDMHGIDFDYIKGYFGQKTEQIDPDTLNTELDEILSHISGQFHISNPSIKLNYSNSFGIPIEVTINAKGKRDLQTVSLGLDPFTIDYPNSLSLRDVSSSDTISKANSSLPDLVSLPPSEVSFSGSAKMNPLGPGGGRNNYLFGNSRFKGSLEVEVPLELWIKNLQFSDTLDNFLKPSNDTSSSFKPEDMDFFQIKIVANNGFPLGAAIKMQLYDSVKNDTIKTINAKEIILPAPIGANGIASGKTESTTTIDFNKDFFSAINAADKIIFTFTLNTSENGTKDVKIYSDYSISFKVSLLVRPNIKL
jgi:hypothetical protein